MPAQTSKRVRNTQLRRHFIIGNDGGIAITYDKGGTYDFPATFPMGQFYAVSFDMQKPYRV